MKKACHSFEINANYQLHNDEIHISDIPLHIFQWINKFMLYLPMPMGSTVKGKKRKCMLILAIICIGINVVHFSLAIWWIFESIWRDNTLANSIYITEEICIILSRMLSIYYCYKHCNYPWLNQIENIYINLPDDIHTKMEKFNRQIKYIFHISIFIVSLEFITYGLDDYYNEHYGFAMNDFFALFFVFLPQYTLFTVAFSIFVKYFVYLSCLTEKVRNKSENDTECNFADLLKEYTSLINGYNDDYEMQNNKYFSSLK